MFNRLNNEIIKKNSKYKKCQAGERPPEQIDRSELFNHLLQLYRRYHI